MERRIGGLTKRYKIFVYYARVVQNGATRVHSASESAILCKTLVIREKGVEQYPVKKCPVY